MPLQINLRHLETRDIELKGDMPLDELKLELQDEVLQAVKPLEYDIWVQKVDCSLLLQGSLVLPLQCHCVRCLKSFEHRLELKDWTRHVPLEGEESAPIVNDCVDLTPYVREDILLDLPQHPLCETECQGLPKPGKPDNAGGAGQSEDKSSAWSELDKLKL